MTQQIIVLFGIQARDYYWERTDKLLNEHCDPKPSTPNTFTFPKNAGKAAHYQVTVCFELSDFDKALNTPGAVVVYTGHSRYGQGPAFGPAGIAEMPEARAFPTNPWGVHFRMGYDATPTKAMADLMLHSVTPGEFDILTTPSSAFLSAGLAAVAAKAQGIKPGSGCFEAGSWRAFNACEAGRANSVTARGDKPLNGRHYYQHLGSATEFMTAVAVGSTDLNRSKLPGTLLVMGSCSSYVHYFGPLDRQRRATKSDCKFILTGELCYADLATELLRQVLVNKVDPTTEAGMKTLVKRFNGVEGAGLVGLY